MPTAAPKPCAHPRCSAVVERGQRFCTTHTKATRKVYERNRGNATDRGYDAAWRRARAAYLAEHPLCCVCHAETPPRLTVATVVDHIVSIADAPHLRLDASNLRAMCVRHHNQRTGRDQGWGRGR